MLTVKEFQSVPSSPKELRVSIVTKATAPSGTPVNASTPTVGAAPWNVMLVRLLQIWKAASPMLVTLSGIVMLVRLVQLKKAQPPMLVTPSGIVMLVRLVQELKA